MLKRLTIGFVILTFLTMAWTVTAQDTEGYRVQIKNLADTDMTIELEGVGEITVPVKDSSEFYDLPDENVSLSYQTADGGFGFTATALSESNEGILFLLPAAENSAGLGDIVFTHIVTTPGLADLSPVYLLDTREMEFGETGISFFEIASETGSFAVSAETVGDFGEPVTAFLAPGQYTVSVYLLGGGEAPVIDGAPFDVTNGDAVILFTGETLTAFSSAAE